MQHEDHVRLLRDGVAARGGVWADLGSGGGAFTLALADLLGPTATITSIDKDRGALREQERAMRARFPGATVEYRVADFTKPLDLPPLDGLVMANSLHFVREKAPVLALVRRYLKPGWSPAARGVQRRSRQHVGAVSDVVSYLGTHRGAGGLPRHAYARPRAEPLPRRDLLDGERQSRLSDAEDTKDRRRRP